VSGQRSVVITGTAAVSAFGRGSAELIRGALAGVAAFAPVSRFDVSRRRVQVAALLPGQPRLDDELSTVVRDAVAEAGLDETERSASPLLLALHGDPDAARAPAARRAEFGAGAFAARIARASGLAQARAYTSACVAASSAVADGAAMIARGDTTRVVVAAGYLVEPDQFALFDAGRALAVDSVVRPFSAGRRGLLLGDGVAAIVLESADAAAARGATAQAVVAGWGRAGDAYHVCQPRPDGSGLARAIEGALGRAGVKPDEIGYINAHGSGTPASDAMEANALRRALGPTAAEVPISSTKSLHGQALEASPLLEIIVTVLAMRAGALPVNAGYLDRDDECRLNLILDGALPARPTWALCLNAAFGGANTAIVVCRA
jgi:3-oxoacyl-[acyl-carrier-protein] synthase II